MPTNVFDGDQLLREVDASGNVSAAYTWGASGLVSERLPESNKSFWYHFGPQGETRQLTDVTGAVADTYNYTAYGQLTNTTGADVNPFQYGGEVGYYTGATGQPVLCTYRWYDTSMGRWLSRDPIGYDGGDNRYGYVSENPISLSDPLGLDPGGTGNMPSGPGFLPPGPGGTPRVPPGYSDSDWSSGSDARGAYLQDPAGNKYYPHNEDRDHWSHYDKVQPTGKTSRYPENCFKRKSAYNNRLPQKGKLGPNQSETDPWEEAEKEAVDDLAAEEAQVTKAAEAAQAALEEKQVIDGLQAIEMGMDAANDDE